MLPSSDPLKPTQLNISIPTFLKEEIKEKAKLSNLNLAEYVQKILESFCQEPLVLDELPNLQSKWHPKEQQSKTSSYSVSTSMNSQLNLDQLIQCLNDRLNRLEGAYVTLLTQIQELQSIKNFYPLLSQLNDQPFPVFEQPAKQDFQHPLTKKQVPTDDFLSAPLGKETQQDDVPNRSPKTPQAALAPKTAAKKTIAKPPVPSDLDSLDWLTAKEAYALVCQQGYQRKFHNFVDLSRNSNANQRYAEWKLVCDPARKGKPGHPGKWFRCLTDSEK